MKLFRGIILAKKFGIVYTESDILVVFSDCKHCCPAERDYKPK